MDKVVELVDEGSVINGAYSVYFIRDLAKLTHEICFLVQWKHHIWMYKSNAQFLTIRWHTHKKGFSNIFNTMALYCILPCFFFCQVPNQEISTYVLLIFYQDFLNSSSYAGNDNLNNNISDPTPGGLSW